MDLSRMETVYERLVLFKIMFSHKKNKLLEVSGMPKSMKGWSQTDTKKTFEKVMQKAPKTKAKRIQNRAETVSEKSPSKESVQDATTSNDRSNLGLSQGCPGVEKGQKAREAPKAGMALTLFLYKTSVDPCIFMHGVWCM